MLKAIAHIIQFFTLKKYQNGGRFSKREKKCVFSSFFATKKQLKSKFKKVLDMRYSYSCKEYVVKTS